MKQFDIGPSRRTYIDAYIAPQHYLALSSSRAWAGYVMVSQ